MFFNALKGDFWQKMEVSGAKMGSFSTILTRIWCIVYQKSGGVYQNLYQKWAFQAIPIQSKSFQSSPNETLSLTICLNTNNWLKMNDLGRYLRLYTNKVIDLLGPPLLTLCDSRGIETPLDYQCFRSNFDTFWSVYQSRLESPCSLNEKWPPCDGHFLPLWFRRDSNPQPSDP